MTYQVVRQMTSERNKKKIPATKTATKKNWETERDRQDKYKTACYLRPKHDVV